MNNCCSHSETEAILADAGESKTRNKIEILSFIKEAKEPLSSIDIASLMPSTNESTIFRNLQRFVSLNIIKEIDLGEGFRRFEIAPKNHHHHHIICTDCNSIDLISKCDISILEKQFKKLGYKNLDHKIEFSGICSACQ